MALAVPRPFRVLSRRRETPRCVTLRLEPMDGLPYAFLPGQFNMLGAFGHGDVPISLSGPLTHTVAAVGLATRALCGLRKGDFVSVRGPFGQGWPLEAAGGGDLLVVAGGVGLAPLRPLLKAHDARRLVVVAGARRPEELLYRRELEPLDPLLTVDLADRNWSGRVGTVLPLLPAALERLERAACRAFVCGPEVMLRLACRDLVRLGLAAEQIWVSLERNMKCAYGVCGHCQLGPKLICRDGPVFPYSEVARWLEVREL